MRKLKSRTSKLAVLIIMMLLALFTVAGLSACSGISLANYKSQAKAELDAYATPSEYSEANWQAVLEIIADGKAAIDEAANKSSVDAAKQEAITAIDRVRKVNMLCNEQIRQIKQSAYEVFYPDFVLEEIRFFYYGTFNENVVIMINPDLGGRQAWYDIFEIYYPNTNFIKVWNNSAFFNLSESLERGLLSENDIQQIAVIHEREFNNIYHNKGYSFY